MSVYLAQSVTAHGATMEENLPASSLKATSLAIDEICTVYDWPRALTKIMRC